MQVAVKRVFLHKKHSPNPPGRGRAQQSMHACSVVFNGGQSWRSRRAHVPFQILPGTKRLYERTSAADRAVGAEAAQSRSQDGTADERRRAAHKVHHAGASVVNGARAEQQVAVGAVGQTCIHIFRTAV